MAGPLLPRVIAILERHAKEICSSYYTNDDFTPTRHCLLGWMALEAEVALPQRRYNTHVIGMAGTRRFANELQRNYGLTLQQLKQLQLVNDETNDVQKLIKMVIALVRQWDEHIEMAA